MCYAGSIATIALSAHLSFSVLHPVLFQINRTFNNHCISYFCVYKNRLLFDIYNLFSIFNMYVVNTKAEKLLFCTIWSQDYRDIIILTKWPSGDLSF